MTKCDQQAETIIKEGDFWLDYVEESDKYIIHLHCPYDYCKPSDEIVTLNFNSGSVTGADAQCANKRSGLLCGQCSNGTSLSIGSSHCIQCPTYWPLLTAIVLTISAIAGILFVTLLLMINLTVAVGSLNGIIFYANMLPLTQILYSLLLLLLHG